MTLTISYKNGEFSCSFTPDDDASVRITGGGAVPVGMKAVELGDEETHHDHQDPTENMEMTVEMIMRDQEGAPAVASIEESAAREETATGVERSSLDLEKLSLYAKDDLGEIDPDDSLLVGGQGNRQSAVYLGNYRRMRDRAR
ncbi:MAG: hypothetical protein O2913_08025 [Chloroflexi bacterium]|nr:hypothetical protein [Chloroflexota bacterium]